MGLTAKSLCWGAFFLYQVKKPYMAPDDKVNFLPFPEPTKIFNKKYLNIYIRIYIKKKKNRNKKRMFLSLSQDRETRTLLNEAHHDCSVN